MAAGGFLGSPADQDNQTSVALARAIDDVDIDDPFPRSVLADLRPTFEDTERTKALKDAFRSFVEMHHLALQDLPKAAPPAVQKKRQTTHYNAVNRKASGIQELRIASASLNELRNSERAEDFAELAGARELAPVLRECSKRVLLLVDKIQDALPPLTDDKSSGHSLTTLTHKGDGENEKEEARAPDHTEKVVRSHIERATASYLKEILHFGVLDELSSRVNTSKDYHDLRRIFPTHHAFHPNVPLLADHTLLDRREFRRCIWSPDVPMSLDYCKTPQLPIARRRSSISVRGMSTFKDGSRTSPQGIRRAATTTLMSGLLPNSDRTLLKADRNRQSLPILSPFSK